MRPKRQPQVPEVKPSVVIRTERRELSELSIKLSMDAVRAAILLFLKQKDPELDLDDAVVQVDIESVDYDADIMEAVGVTVTRSVAHTDGPKIREIK